MVLRSLGVRNGFQLFNLPSTPLERVSAASSIRSASELLIYEASVILTHWNKVDGLLFFWISQIKTRTTISYKNKIILVKMDIDQDQMFTLFASLDLTNPDDPVKEHKSKKEKKEEKMIVWKDVRRKKKDRIKEKRIEKKAVFKTKAEYEQSELYKRRRMEEEMKKKWKDVTIDQIQFFKPWVVVDLNFNELLEARVSTSCIENIN